MAAADRVAVADDVESALQGRDIEELNTRPGHRPGRGYVHPAEAADEILDEALQPFLDDLHRRAGLGMRSAAAELLADSAQVRAVTRDPATANLPPEMDVTGGDHAAPGTFTGAVRGAGALFVNIGAIRTGPGDLLAAARDAGLSKIVLLSSTTVRTRRAGQVRARARARMRSWESRHHALGSAPPARL